MDYVRKLVGKKCYLSPISAEDARVVAKWSNDLEVGMYTGDIADMISVERQEEYLTQLSREHYGFLIVESSTSQPIGMCKLIGVDFIHRNATLGIFIGEKEYRYKGIGTEALRLLMDFGFSILNLNNIMLKVFSFNTPAIRVYQKCGFKEIGRRRQCVIYGSSRYDDVYMDILAEDFRGHLTEGFLKKIK